ncbi:MAG: amine dehydrogenase large subunit [Pseudomonadota bacterium]
MIRWIATALLAMSLLACSKTDDAEPAAPAAASEAAATTEAAAPAPVAATAGADSGIAPEPLGIIRSLPEDWPANWLVVHDASFFHMSDGKFVILDLEADTQPEQFKGMFNGSKIAQFIQSSSRPEFYVAETFLSRGQRGDRTDVLSVVDKSTLAVVDEVIIPSKRVHQIPTQYAVQLTGNESMALVFNLTPATSVSVVDLDAREFKGEIPIPGCAGVYPTGSRGFSALCGDGTIISMQLDADGSLAGEPTRSAKFFDTDADALFERAAMVGTTGYFPTFMGNMVPIDLGGENAAVGEAWSLLGPDDAGWRPGGIQLAAADAKGRVFVLMHADGYEGSHKDPGTEVWVFDPATGQRVDRIALQVPAITIEVTGGSERRLVTTNVEMGLDVYDASNGKYIKTMAAFGQETPLLLVKSR